MAFLPLNLCPNCGCELADGHCIVCNPRDDIEQRVAEAVTVLGPCCICERTHEVVNVVMLAKKAPQPGVGCWGCYECGLPMEGAVAVLCQECFALHRDGKAQIKFACVGAPRLGMRVPIASLTEDFYHHRARHFIAGKYSPN